MFLFICLPIFLSLLLPSCLLLLDEHMPLQTSLTNPTPPPQCSPSSDTTNIISPAETTSSTLFCIHKYFFEQEATKFFVPPYTNPDDNTPHGTFTSHPIILHDISIYDFKQFLWVFYNPQLSLYNNTPGNWWSIGCLAGLWGFDKVPTLSNESWKNLKMSFTMKPLNMLGLLKIPLIVQSTSTWKMIVMYHFH